MILKNFLMDGFEDEDTTTGWVLLLELDRHGVRRWDTRVARLDREGIPHPAPEAKSPCWERGQEKVTLCEIASPAPAAQFSFVSGVFPCHEKK